MPWSILYYPKTRKMMGTKESVVPSHAEDVTGAGAFQWNLRSGESDVENDFPLSIRTQPCDRNFKKLLAGERCFLHFTFTILDLRYSKLHSLTMEISNLSDKSFKKIQFS